MIFFASVCSNTFVADESSKDALAAFQEMKN